MDKYTSEKVQEAFITPLTLLIKDLQELCVDLDKGFKSGEIKRDYLPLNDAKALAALRVLQGFLKYEAKVKLEKVQEPDFRYRDKELKHRSDNSAD